MIGGFLLVFGDPNLIVIGEILIAIALGGQVAADYLKQQGIIEYAGAPIPIYTILKLLLTVFSTLGVALVDSGFHPVFGYVLIAIAMGGMVAIDYLKDQGIITKHKKRTR
jgi:hypothetical protein